MLAMARPLQGQHVCGLGSLHVWFPCRVLWSRQVEVSVQLFQPLSTCCVTRMSSQTCTPAFKRTSVFCPCLLDFSFRCRDHEVETVASFEKRAAKSSGLATLEKNVMCGRPKETELFFNIHMLYTLYVLTSFHVSFNNKWLEFDSPTTTLLKSP